MALTDAFTMPRLRKIRQALYFLVPAVYAAVMLQSVTDVCFPADDPQELNYVNEMRWGWLLRGHDVFGLFRPVKNLLWILFSKLNTFGFEWCHVFAITIGILSFFPVLALCRRIYGSDWKAFAAAAVWLLSPTLVSSVAWLSCVNIQVMAAFAALTIVFHDKAWNGESFRPSRIVFAGVFLFLALVSYECAIALAPILVFFDLTLRPERLRKKKPWIAHIGYWTVVLAYLVLRHAAGAKGTAGGRWIEASRGHLVVSSPWFALQHVASWFWPFGRFSVGGSYVWGEVSVPVLAGCAVLGIVLLALAWRLRKRRPALSFSLFFAIFGLAPVCNCLGLGNGPYGDYYLTLASIGLATGSIELSWWLAETEGRWRIPAYAIVAAFVLVRLLSIPEAGRWANLWTRADLAYAEAARNFPDSLQNKVGKLRECVIEGRWDEALEIGRQIEDILPPDSRKMGQVFLVRLMYELSFDQNRERALQWLNRYASVADPAESKKLVPFYRGRIYEVIEKDVIAAENEYGRALLGGADSSLVPCLDSLARLKFRHGDNETAFALWDDALSIDPNNVPILWEYANACHELGKKEQAESLLDRVRKMTGNPDLTWSDHSRFGTANQDTGSVKTENGSSGHPSP